MVHRQFQHQMETIRRLVRSPNYSLEGISSQTIYQRTNRVMGQTSQPKKPGGGTFTKLEVTLILFHPFQFHSCISSLHWQSRKRSKPVDDEGTMGTTLNFGKPESLHFHQRTYFTRLKVKKWGTFSFYKVFSIVRKSRLGRWKTDFLANKMSVKPTLSFNPKSRLWALPIKPTLISTPKKAYQKSREICNPVKIIE